MSFLINNAYAAEAGAQQASATGGIEFIIMIAIFFALMYFMIIRPQSKRAKEHRQLLEALSKGDEVVTSGGVVGKVRAVGENFVEIETTEGGPVLKIQKQAVTAVLPKGTIKDL